MYVLYVEKYPQFYKNNNLNIAINIDRSKSMLSAV